MDMKRAIEGAIAGVLSLGVLSATAQAGPAEAPKFAFEKCYGVVKAGKNDCQTSTHACAGTATSDGQGDAWVYLPKGSCEKIVGGSLEMKS